MRDTAFRILVLSFLVLGLSAVVAASASAYGISQTYPTGSRPIDVEISKLDSGPTLDVVTANRDGRNISILLGDGAGTFTANTQVELPQPAGGGPRYSATGVAIGRFNKDKRPDLFVAGSDFGPSGDALLVFRGTAAGLNPTPKVFPVGTESVQDVVVADFDRDGRLDAALGDSKGSSVYTLFGKKGGFKKAKQTTFALPDPSPSVGSEPQFLEVGDFNRDKFPDVAAAVGRLRAFGVLYTKTKVKKPRRKKNGTRTKKRIVGKQKFKSKTYPSGGMPYGFASGDLNDDGRLDLASPDDYGSSNDTVSVIYGTGKKKSAGFTAPQQVDIGGDVAGGTAIGDYGGSPADDLVSYNASTLTVSYLISDPAEPDGFQGPVDVSVFSDVIAMRSADLNGDGLEDFVGAQFNDGNVAVSLSD